MMRRAFLPLLLVLFGAAVPAPVRAGVGDWTSYTWANAVSGLAADGNALWWATSGGAVRTDLGSLQTTVFHRGRGTLVSDTLATVCVAGDGVVWFGSSDRAVSAYDPATGRWSRIQGIDGLPDARAQALACSGTSLWVGTPRGFAEFRNGVATANSCTQGVDLGCGLVSFDIRSILITQDARWLGTALGVSRWTAGVWDTVSVGLAAGDVASLADLDGEVWAVAGSTPYRFDGSQWILAAGGLGGAQARRLAVLGGVLYAATSAGLYRWNDGWSRVGTSLDATAAAIDGTGRLWVGTAASGVSWWDGAAWHQVLAPGPQDDKVIRGLAVGSDGALWFSERYPVLGRFSNGVWQKLDHNTTHDSLESQWTSALQFARNGDLWIGHCCCAGDVDCRVDRLSASGAWLLPVPAAHDVISMDQDPSGDFWLGTLAANESDTPSGVFFYSHEDGSVTQLLPGQAGGCLPSNQFPAILAPADGRVVLGSLGDGVAIWDYGSSIADLSDDHCTTYSAPDALPSNEVTALLWRGGDLWVGTTAGVSVIDVASGARRILDTSVGLAGSQVTGLASDPLGHVWVTTSTGVSMITAGASSDVIQNFGYPDLVNEHVNAVALDASRGLLWFGTNHGISSYQGWNPGGGPSAGLSASVYPNPFRPALHTTGLRLLADGGGALHGEVYDVAGKRVATFNGVMSRRVVWDGTLSSKEPAPSGYYVIVVRSASGATATASVVLVR